MTSKIEETKREMYRALAALKSGGRWLLKKANAEAFESALEEHLEASRQELAEMTRLRKCFETLAVDYTKKSVLLEDENKSLKSRLEEALERVDIYGDAHRHQVHLTHSACVRERVLFDDLHETKRNLAMADSDCGHAQQVVDQQKERIHQQDVLIAAQRQAIGQLYMVKGVMSKQIVQLVEELDVLKMANKVAGEELLGRKGKYHPRNTRKIIRIPADQFFKSP